MLRALAIGLLLLGIIRIGVAIATIVITKGGGIDEGIFDTCKLWLDGRMSYCKYIIAVGAVSLILDVVILIARSPLSFSRRISPWNSAPWHVIVDGFFFTWWLIPLVITAEWAHIYENESLYPRSTSSSRVALAALMGVAAVLSLLNILCGLALGRVPKPDPLSSNPKVEPE